MEQTESNQPTPQSQNGLFTSKNLIPLSIFAVILIVLSTLTTYFILKSSMQKEPSNKVISPAQGGISPTISPDETQNWKTYAGKTFTFKYPSDWETISNGATRKVIFKENDKDYYLSLEDGGRGGPEAERIENRNISLDGRKFILRSWINGDEPFFISVMPDEPNTDTEDFNHIEMILPPKNNQKYLDILNKIILSFKFSDQKKDSNSNTTLVTSSNCMATISVPSAWTAKEYFISPKRGDITDYCKYLTAPDYSEGTDSRGGFYVSILRTAKGSKFDDITINTLDDYIKVNETVIDPATTVGNRENKKIGIYNGIEYDPLGYDPGRSFIFEKNGYIYEVNWPTEHNSPYSSIVEQLISSINIDSSTR